MEVYVIRHGQSEALVNGIHAGWGPTPLSPLGMEQAEEAGRKLDGIPFDKVYVSDLVRTRQTAERVFPGYPYIFEPRVREFSSGRLEGKRVAECREELGEPYIRARHENDYTAYGGENEDMVTLRIQSFMRDLEKDEADGCSRVAVVCHAGAIRQMVYEVLQCRFPRQRLRTDCCCIVRLACHDGNCELHF